ncbi:MAG: ATP-binding cassette domain-containing protein [Pseudomonadota bacterium]
MLHLNDVVLRRGDFALRADASLVAGKVTALMGSSGSGKSTLLAAIAGFEAPVSGRITLDGRDITDLAPGDRPVSILFQDGNLFPHLTVAQNVGLGLRPDLRLSKQQVSERDQVLARVGLGGMPDRLPRDLSGGQQSRAALARALVSGRSWLLLDEAFSALGPALRREMLALVRDMAESRGMSVLMVTHDPRDARQIADFTGLIHEGHLSDPRPTSPLFADPPPELLEYLGDSRSD